MATNIAPSSVIDAFFKENYSKPDQVAKLVHEDNTFLKWLPKDPAGATERRYITPVMYGDPQALAATRAGAQTIGQLTGAGSNDIAGQDWIVPYGGYAASHFVKEADIRLQAGSERWLDVQKEAVDGILRMWGNVMETYLCRGAGHALGSGTISSGVITLTNVSEAKNFAPGMILEASANDGSSTAHALINASLGYVIAVNANAGTVTVSATDGGSAGTPTSWTGTMYFFRYKDFQGEGSSYDARNIVDSIQQWIPTADPSATAFRNVVRTTSVIALSGVRLTSTEYSRYSAAQRLRRLAVKFHRVGYNIGGDMAFWASPTQWENIANELEAAGHRDLEMKEAVTGTTAIKIRGPNGIIPLMSGNRFPDDGAWLLSRNSMKLATAGAFPYVLSGDGLQMLRVSDADTYEQRWKGICALCVRAPGANGYVPLATS